MGLEKEFKAQRRNICFLCHLTLFHCEYSSFPLALSFFLCPQPPARHVPIHSANTHTHNDICEWFSDLWWHRRKHGSHIAAESLNKAPCLSRPIRPLICPGQSRSGASSAVWCHLTCLLTSQDLSGRGLWNAVDTRPASSADSRSTHTYRHTHTFTLSRIHTQRSFILLSSWFTCVKCHTKGERAWNSVAWMDVFSKPAQTLVMKIFSVPRFPLQMVCSPGRQITVDCLNSDRLCVYVPVCVCPELCGFICVCVCVSCVSECCCLCWTLRMCVCAHFYVHLHMGSMCWWTHALICV